MEIVVSVLSAIVVALLSVVISLILKSQTKFEGRIDKHVHDLRDDIQACTGQILVLKTIIFMGLPEEQRQKFESMPIFNQKKETT